MKYPDSVKRVRPPNTTIPKTLAALPSSQYATDFELVSGKELLFAFASETCSTDGGFRVVPIVVVAGACLWVLLLLLRLEAGVEKAEAACRR